MRVASYVLVLVLAALCAVWGTFLVPLRIASVPFPVSLVVAVGGNLLLGRAGGRLYGRVGAAGPGVLWFLIVSAFATGGFGGDVVVTGLVGLLFLLLGAVAAGAAVGRRGPRTAAGSPAPHA